MHPPFTAKNPVKLARHIMDNTIHCYIAGPGADLYAEKHGLELVPNSYFSTEKRQQQLRSVQQKDSCATQLSEDIVTGVGMQADPGPGQKMGTVGAVCYYKGNTAAATSTGGMTNKLPGRVGDAPIMGAGTYANNSTCAVSCTGHGEIFIRYTVASSVSNRLRFGPGMKLPEAVRQVVHKDIPPDTGGLIAVNAEGYSMEFNTPGMYRGCCTEREGVAEAAVGIWEEMLPVPL